MLIAAGTGAAIGTVFSRVMHHQHALRVQEQIARGGLLLWVNVRNVREQETALEVLKAHSAHDVHAHEIEV